MRSTVSSSSVHEMRVTAGAFARLVTYVASHAGILSSIFADSGFGWTICIALEALITAKMLPLSRPAQRLVRLHRRVRRFLLLWTSSEVGIVCSRGKCRRFKWTNQISKQVRTADTDSPLKKREWDWITEEVLHNCFWDRGTRRSAICRFCFPVPCNSPSHDGRVSVPKQWNGGQIGVPKQWNGGHVGVPNQSCGSRTHFLCKRFLLFQNICRDAGHVSKKALWQQCEIKLIVYVILCYISPMKYLVFKRKKVKLWLN